MYSVFRVRIPVPGCQFNPCAQRSPYNAAIRCGSIVSMRRGLAPGLLITSGVLLMRCFASYEVAEGPSAVGGGGSGATAGAAGAAATAGSSAGTAGIGGSGGHGGNAGSGAAAATGGAGGTAGSGATDGGADCGDAGTCGPLEECGSAGTTQLCVAKKVSVKAPEGGTYFIDATEVTAAQYSAWFATMPSVSALPDYCKSNSDGGVWKPAFNACGGEGNYPAVNVDWCDAYGYCLGVDKRLCGKIGGGANWYIDDTKESVDQWYNACTSGGTVMYPYGNTYLADICDGSDYWANRDAGSLLAALPVGSMSGCESSVQGFRGVYDLSGNVWEREDSCNGTSGDVDQCHVRGGSFADAGNYLKCEVNSTSSRSSRNSAVGFRCCGQ
jgi:formylglycine-generating enzyme